jgi:hypothetical protein
VSLAASSKQGLAVFMSGSLNSHEIERDGRFGPFDRHRSASFLAPIRKCTCDSNLAIRNLGAKPAVVSTAWSPARYEGRRTRRARNRRDADRAIGKRRMATIDDKSEAGERNAFLYYSRLGRLNPWL